MNNGRDLSDDAQSPCCGQPYRARPVSTSTRLVVRQCSACRILWGRHVDLASGKPWDDAYLSDEFVLALRNRREKQASSMASVLTRYRAAEPILDYGSGQGVLLAQLTRAGLDAWGCDLDPDIPLSASTKERTIHVDQPWEMPAGEWQSFHGSRS